MEGVIRVTFFGNNFRKKILTGLFCKIQLWSALDWFPFLFSAPRCLVNIFCRAQTSLLFLSVFQFSILLLLTATYKCIYIHIYIYKYIYSQLGAKKMFHFDTVGLFQPVLNTPLCMEIHQTIDSLSSFGWSTFENIILPCFRFLIQIFHQTLLLHTNLKTPCLPNHCILKGKSTLLLNRDVLQSAVKY